MDGSGPIKQSRLYIDNHPNQRSLELVSFFASVQIVTKVIEDKIYRNG